jgi:Neuraminidase (sialidase)
VELKDADMKDVDRFSVGASGGGGVFITSSWNKGSGSPEKASVFFYRSEDNGSTWSAPRKMNTNEYDNTSSFLPAMHVKDDGTIFIAWEDHRDIRGDIYINYSKDSGKTWLEKEINLSKGQGKQNNTYPFIAYGKGTYHVLWMRYADDRLAGDGDLFVDEYTIKEKQESAAGGKR